MASDVGVTMPAPSNVVSAVGAGRAVGAEAWTESWRRNEFSYLHDQLERAQRQLRRRTAILGGALVLSVGLAGAFATLTFVETPWGNAVKSGIAGLFAGRPEQPQP